MSKIVKNVHRVTKGALVKGEWVEVEGTITFANGKTRTCKRAGYFDGVRYSDWEGDEELLYAYFRGGFIGETPQGDGSSVSHGFPLSTFEIEENEYANLVEVGQDADVLVSGDNRFVLAFVECEPETFVWILLDQVDQSLKEFVSDVPAKSYVLRQSV